MIAATGGSLTAAINFVDFSWRTWGKSTTSIHSASSTTRIKRGSVFGLKISQDKTYYGVLVFPDNRYRLLGIKDKSIYEYLIAGSVPSGAEAPVSRNQNGFIRVQKFRRYFLKQFKLSYLSAKKGKEFIALAKRLDAVLLAACQYAEFVRSGSSDVAIKPHPAQDKAAQPIFNYFSANTPFTSWTVSPWNPLKAKAAYYCPEIGDKLRPMVDKDQLRIFAVLLRFLNEFLSENFLKANNAAVLSRVHKDLIITYSCLLAKRQGEASPKQLIKTRQLLALPF